VRNNTIYTLDGIAYMPEATALVPVALVKPHLTSFQDTCEDISDLPDQLREVRIVVYDIIGEAGLVVQRNLKIFSNSSLVLVENAVFFRSFGPQPPVALDKNELIAAFLPPDLGQKGHVQDDGFHLALPVVTPDKSFCPLHNARVDYTI